MSPTYWEREDSSRDLVSVAYLLVVLGMGLFLVGIALLISNESVFQRYAPYMNLGIAMFVIGLIVLVLRSVLLSMFLSDKRKTGKPTSSGNPCPACNRPMTWIPQHQRWFCQYCQKYA